ncbi:GGDEF domain-containing protein [Deinococcus yunweiensis]|uniref:GGDEF domain-containing protein n=1 Tax=Deinococcus yunweiensis TaxID=367282 RepID=UPI00398E72FB
MLTLLAALATATQVGTLLFQWARGEPSVSRTLLSAVITAILTGMSMWSRLPLRTVQRGSVALICVMFIMNVTSVFTTGRAVTSGLLIHLVILALLSFTWLPPRVAAGLLGVTYLLLAGTVVASSVPDVPGTLLVGFTLPLMWHLTLHGREVNRERVRGEVLRTLAYRDPLTGVHNRRSGAELLNTLLRTHTDGGSGTEVAVGVIDLDHFKRINDTLGHQQGDRVLVAVADSLAASFAPDGTVVRWGGEEFLVILTGQSRASARQQVDAALDAVRTLQQGGLPMITISAGLAFSGEARDQGALLDLADGRLYRAKAAGRDRVH